MRKTFPTVLAAAIAALTLASCNGSSRLPSTDGPPNIVFVVMDDVGIDQMASFGYGGATAPRMPNMDAVAKAGVRFRNTWSMPECSPGRAAFFVGRYPFRTNIYQAIGPNDLANAQISPYDVTVPKLLKQAHYESAMFGKFHLAGPENNAAGDSSPAALGLDHFYGWVGGLPGSIDTTAGGVATEKTHACGFVPSKAAGGTNTGACYQPNQTCAVVSQTSPSQDAAGLQCLNSGGVFVANQSCGTPPAALNFNRENAYYVSPLVIIDGAKVEKVALTDPRARGYRTRLETDAAIDWVKTRTPGKPWMATLSYTAAHTPWQQPPGSLLKHSGPADDTWSCTDTGQGRLLQNKMTEAMDSEFGRFMVSTGLAKRGSDGSLVYDPKATNTVIVIVGDNGSLGSAVKRPFPLNQAKGTAYQAGVWDPLVIAGPQVVQADREVEHMVNMVDLFQFFGELAGIDVHKAVPRTLDSVGVLAYLTNPAQSSLRTINFTMGGFNQQANGTRNEACVINTSCTQIPISKSVCEDNQGVWWGIGYNDPDVIDNGGAGYQSCAQVNQALFKASPSRSLLSILPEVSTAIRNDRFKLVRNTTQTYDSAVDRLGSVVTEELFEINQAVGTPLLDTPDRNLLPATTTQTQAVYAELQATLDNMLASNPVCPGDGNRDGVVNGEDMSNWSRIAREWGLSSVYDFIVNRVSDGLTNEVDADTIRANQGKSCPKTTAIY